MRGYDVTSDYDSELVFPCLRAVFKLLVSSKNSASPDGERSTREKLPRAGVATVSRAEYF